MNNLIKYIIPNIITASSVFYFSNKLEKNEPILNTIFKDDCSSKTILTVTKKVKDTWDNDKIDVYENDKKWLKILSNEEIVPNLISFDDEKKLITTEYAGEVINENNIPSDWEKQMDNIISILKKYNCRHNDIKPTEILVKDKKIKIIDFGWANELDKTNPDYWPKGLGSRFKCNIFYDENGEKIDCNLGFDDKCSFIKSINHYKNK